MKQLIVITGPTASGKTDLTVQLAELLNTEIVSCDSRQFYRELKIGTAKPSAEEQRGIPHHFIDCMSIGQFYTAGDYERDAVNRLNELFKKHDRVILTGGSGLYLNAVLYGLDKFPDVTAEARSEVNALYEREGLGGLHRELQKRDADYYEECDLNNHTRIIRALEVCYTAGKSFSSFRTRTPKQRPWESRVFVLDRDREELYDRINRRADEMVEKGLIDEVRRVYPYRQHTALQTVGYREIFEYLDGNIDLDEAVRLIKRNTRRYAKRQFTWFKKINGAEFLRAPFSDLLNRFR